MYQDWQLKTHYIIGPPLVAYAVIVNVISYAFVSTASENVCCEKGLLVTIFLISQI